MFIGHCSIHNLSEASSYNQAENRGMQGRNSATETRFE